MAEGDAPAWRDHAMELYKLAFAELSAKWVRLGDVEGVYLTEEVREALLDLKQAVIEDDHDLAARAVAEVVMLRHALQARYPEAP
jgi:hypothetical protein